MPIQRKHAVFYIPHTGLYYTGAGEFLDGKGEKIKWDRSITVYNTHARAERARNRILQHNPLQYARGELVVINVEIIEKEDEVGDGFR